MQAGEIQTSFIGAPAVAERCEQTKASPFCCLLPDWGRTAGSHAWWAGVGPEEWLRGGCPPPFMWWCAGEGSVHDVPYFCSRLFRSGGLGFWSSHILLSMICLNLHACSYFSPLIVSLSFVAGGDMRPGISSATKGSWVPDCPHPKPLLLWLCQCPVWARCPPNPPWAWWPPTLLCVPAAAMPMHLRPFVWGPAAGP